MADGGCAIHSLVKGFQSQHENLNEKLVLCYGSKRLFFSGMLRSKVGSWRGSCGETIHVS